MKHADRSPTSRYADQTYCISDWIRERAPPMARRGWRTFDLKLRSPCMKSGLPAREPKNPHWPPQKPSRGVRKCGTLPKVLGTRVGKVILLSRNLFRAVGNCGALTKFSGQRVQKCGVLPEFLFPRDQKANSQIQAPAHRAQKSAPQPKHPSTPVRPKRARERKPSLQAPRQRARERKPSLQAPRQRARERKPSLPPITPCPTKSPPNSP